MGNVPPRRTRRDVPQPSPNAENRIISESAVVARPVGNTAVVQTAPSIPDSFFLPGQAPVESTEEDNFVHLVNVAWGVGQEIIRKVLKRKIGPHDSDLHSFIQTRRRHIQQMRLFPDERNILLPEDNNAIVRYEQLDFSLSYKILRNICRNHNFGNPGERGGNHDETTNSVIGDIENLRTVRNYLAHLTSNSVKNEDYCMKLRIIKTSVSNLEKALGLESKLSAAIDRSRDTSNQVESVQLKKKCFIQEELLDKDSEGPMMQHIYDSLQEIKRNLRDVEARQRRELVDWNLSRSICGGRSENILKCRREEDKYFAETEEYGKAKSILEEKHHVLITGRKGCGKTSLAYHLILEWMSKDKYYFYTLYNPTQFDEIQPTENALILIDAMSIDRREWIDLFTHLHTNIESDLNLFVIIAAPRNSVRNARAVSSSCVFLSSSHTVDLSYEELTREEKRHIINCQIDKMSKLNNVTLNLTDQEKDEITECKDCLISFPLAVSEFLNKRKSQDSTSFSQPIQYLINELSELIKVVKSRLALLIFLLLQEQIETPMQHCEDLFHQIGLNEFQRKHGSCELLQKAAEYLDDDYMYVLYTCDGTPQLANNPCIKNVIAYIYGREFTQSAIAYLPLNHFTQITMFQGSPPPDSTCINFSSENDLVCFCERLLKEIQEGNLKTTSYLNIWTSGHFLEIFERVLDEKSRMEKKGLLLVQENGKPFLSWIVRNQKHDRILSILLSQLQLDTDEGDLTIYLNNALLEACSFESNIRIIELLLTHGAKPSFCAACAEKKHTDESKHLCPLDLASLKKDDEAVMVLLQNKAIIPHIKWGGWRFLHTASKNNDRLLCNARIIFSLNMPFYEPQTTDSPEEIFICQSKRLDESDRQNYAKNLFVLCLKTIGLNKELYMTFQEEGVDYAEIFDTDQTPFHIALRSNLTAERLTDTIAVLAKEDDTRKHIDKVDSAGESPLILAIKRIKVETDISIIEYLLCNAADPNCTDTEGRSPLHHCILLDEGDDIVAKVASRLLDFHGNTALNDKSRQTPITLAITRGKRRLLTLAVLVGQNNSTVPQAPVNMLTYCLGLQNLTTEAKFEIVDVLLNQEVNIDEQNENGHTALISAVLNMKSANAYEIKEVVYGLLKRKANVDITDENGDTLLHHCVRARLPVKVKKEMILHIVDKYKCDIERKNNKGMTPLLEASLHAPSLLQLLLERGANIHDADAKGNTVLHLMLRCKLPGDYLCKKINMLVSEYGANVSSTTFDRCTPLKIALMSDPPKIQVIRALFDAERWVSVYTDKENNTYAHLCTMSSIPDINAAGFCKTILEKNPECGFRVNKSGLLPLDIAIARGRDRIKTVELLVQHIEDPIILTKKIKKNLEECVCTPDVMRYLLQDADREIINPYHCMLKAKPTENITTFFDIFRELQFCVDNEDENGLRPLQLAVWKMDTTLITVKWLIKNGANTKSKTEDDDSLLHLAVKSVRNDPETVLVIEELLSHGIDIDGQNLKRQTPLLLAVLNGKLKTVEYLLQREASPYLVDRNKQNILHGCVRLADHDDKVSHLLDIILPYFGKRYINRRDGDGLSPLNAAASFVTHSRIFSMIRLIKASADCDTVDRYGRTPVFNVVRCIAGHKSYMIVERVTRIAVLLLFGGSASSEDDHGKVPLNICSERPIPLRNESKILRCSGSPDEISDTLPGIIKQFSVSVDLAEPTHCSIRFPQIPVAVQKTFVYAASFLNGRELDCNDEAHIESGSCSAELMPQE